MREFTAILQRDGKWFTGICPEVPGANGQGKTREQCLKNLGEAIELMLDVYRQDALKSIKSRAEQTVVLIK